MNILKSLITTASLVAVTSSSVAMADVSATFHAEGSWSSGTTRPQPRGQVVRDHRTPAAPVVRDHRDYRNPVVETTVVDRYWNMRLPRNRRPEPELLISNPRIDVRGNFSVYEGPLGTVSNRPGFVALSQPTRIATIREGFQLASSGQLNALQLQAVRGSTHITQLGIAYENGEQEFITVNQTIDLQHPMTYSIDLKGRNRTITLVNVYGTSSAGSAFQLLGSS